MNFAQVNTNKNAVVHRGSGPWALNYSVLPHPEIAPAKPGSQPASMYEMKTKVPANVLNLSDGLVGTLIDQIVVKKIQK